MKRAFSLIEILIAILIFTFIVLSLYKIIDIAKIDIDATSHKIQTQVQINHNKSILMEDFLESTKINIDTRGESSLARLVTNNTYHNPLFNNVMYILEKKTLYRLESLKTVSKESINNMDNRNIFVDVLYKNIENFLIEKGKNNNYLIYLKRKIDNKEIIISIPYLLNNK